MRRPLALALVLGFALVLPLAGAAVSVEEIAAPERTRAEKPFPVTLRLTNDGDARTVYLFGALYDREEGSAPCGPATDPRFRTFTHTYNEAVRLPARSTTTYPQSGDWLHHYATRDVEAAPELAQFCIFVANASTGPLIQYEGYATTTLSVRGVNALPVTSFTWEPETPRAGEDVEFRAEGSDADGDPVAFRWDFGHRKASGPAVAEGREATTFFYPEGEYVVTLYAGDGLDEAPVSRTITAIAADAPTPEDGSSPLSQPLWILLFAAGAVAIAVRRRARD